jgi:hypothetical protein
VSLLAINSIRAKWARFSEFSDLSRGAVSELSVKYRTGVALKQILSEPCIGGHSAIKVKFLMMGNLIPNR